MKGTIVGTIIRLIRIFLRFDHFPGPQYGADRFRMGLFYGSNARIGQIPGGFYTARPYLRTTSIFPINRPSTGPILLDLGLMATYLCTHLSFTKKGSFSSLHPSNSAISLLIPDSHHLSVRYDQLPRPFHRTRLSFLAVVKLSGGSFRKNGKNRPPSSFLCRFGSFLAFGSVY
jgi:hypothetical protein